MSSTTTFDFTLRYQRTPGAKYHVRPFSLLQQEILYRCDGKVTVADLADATRCTHREIRAALVFLSQHGCVRTLLPDPALLTPRPQASAQHASSPVQGGTWRWFAALKRKRISYEAARR
ncbi:MAG TPA: hypothetical protein VH599_14200 [Ktedonobacterales bacterium]